MSKYRHEPNEHGKCVPAPYDEPIPYPIQEAFVEALGHNIGSYGPNDLGFTIEDMANISGIRDCRITRFTVNFMLTTSYYTRPDILASNFDKITNPTILRIYYADEAVQWERWRIETFNVLSHIYTLDPETSDGVELLDYITQGMSTVDKAGFGVALMKDIADKANDPNSVIEEFIGELSRAQAIANHPSNGGPDPANN